MEVRPAAAIPLHPVVLQAARQPVQVVAAVHHRAALPVPVVLVAAVPRQEDFKSMMI